jgi:FixJ family two-component response regulator
MTPTVFVVDDDAAVRDSLTALIESDGLPVETFASAEDFLAAYRPGRPGCLLLDLLMPGMGGLELQRLLAARGIELPIIFLTGHGSVRDSVRALRGGAVDFLEKPPDPGTVLAEVREALARDAAARAEGERRAEVRRRLGRLTGREREVMRRMVAGRSCKEIARDLGISPRTVEIHRARVLAKLEASSVPDLIGLALASGEPDLQPRLPAAPG